MRSRAKNEGGVVVKSKRKESKHFESLLTSYLRSSYAIAGSGEALER